jgi:hypothetical protein
LRALTISLVLLWGALRFTLGAWRRAWGVQLLAAIGVGLMVFGAQAQIEAERAADLCAVGFAITLVAAAPLLASLMRMRLVGSFDVDLGPAGLQFGPAEARLLAVFLIVVGASLLLWLPVVAAVAVTFVLMHGSQSVWLEGLGPAPASFLIAGGLVAGAGAAFVYMLSRLALVAPATLDGDRIALAVGWRMSRDWGAITAITLLVSLLPTALGLFVLNQGAGVAVYAMTPADAAVRSALVAFAATFIQAPLSAGALAGLYEARRSAAAACATAAKAEVRAQSPFAEAFAMLDA